ncbi:DASH family cryptochrome [Arsukibacterium sp.]|uniref:DASH family cryptochrome n=1 Tax=Arsukibacterium sp. TaxID=1977258 RepID=UPI002FD95EB9
MIRLVLLNDSLRLHDNPLLKADPLPKLAVVCLNKSAYYGRQYGLARANLQRFEQQLRLISQLQLALTTQGIGLVTLFGDSHTELVKLIRLTHATELVAAEPTAPDEYQCLQQLKQHISINLLDCNSLLGAAALAPDLHSFPDQFTAFRKRLEPELKVCTPIAGWSLPHSTNPWFSPEQAQTLNQHFTPLPAMAGSCAYKIAITEADALKRLKHFIWQEQHILHYKDSRNQLAGSDYASFFSASLAAGSLSVRYCWQQISDFEQQVQANDSTYWLKFELLWREFFRWQMRKYQHRWFSKNGIKGPADFSPPRLSARQQQRFDHWCAGNTGMPFVDANMRLLNQTGLMSNRGRQNVASYLIHDLAIDWRLGAAYFEQRLLDYDVASNWGNWAYIAGYGNSMPRPFNLLKQAMQYDAQGQFVRSMLPELSAEGALIHLPANGVVIPEQWQAWLKELNWHKAAKVPPR